MWLILIADITMSTDNILAVPAVANGNVLSLVIGPGVNIPFVALASKTLVTLMDKHPLIVCFGAALLREVSAQLIIRIPLPADFPAHEP